MLKVHPDDARGYAGVRGTPRRRGATEASVPSGGGTEKLRPLLGSRTRARWRRAQAPRPLYWAPAPHGACGRLALLAGKRRVCRRPARLGAAAGGRRAHSTALAQGRPAEPKALSGWPSWPCWRGARAKVWLRCV